jgi:hypothetical protein
MLKQGGCLCWSLQKKYGKTSSFTCSDVSWQCFNLGGKGEA